MGIIFPIHNINPRSLIITLNFIFTAKNMATNVNILHEIFSRSFDFEKDSKPRIKPTLQSIVDVIYKSDDTGPWIAGGCGRQMVVGETTFNDIDVWFKHAYQFEQTKNRLNETFGHDMYETYASDNAQTYQIGDYKVQLIRRAYYPSVDAVFKSFDFTCCQIAVDKNLQPYGPGIDDAKNMRLVLNYYDPKAFLARYAKYVGYGYVMDPKQFIEIMDRKDLNYEFDGSVFGY